MKDSELKELAEKISPFTNPKIEIQDSNTVLIYPELKSSLHYVINNITIKINEKLKIKYKINTTNCTKEMKKKLINLMDSKIKEL